MRILVTNKGAPLLCGRNGHGSSLLACGVPPTTLQLPKLRTCSVVDNVVN